MNIRLLVLAVLVSCSGPRNLVPPEEAAQRFLGDLNVQIQGKPNCTGTDTDGDGYLTCTVMLAAPMADGTKMLSLQCAGVTTDGCGDTGHTRQYAVGCKETTAKFGVPPKQGQGL